MAIERVDQMVEGRKYLQLGGVPYDVTDVPQEEVEDFIAQYVAEKKGSYNPVTETK